jgi:AIPR protein
MVVCFKERNLLDNAKSILRDVISQRKAEAAPEISDDDYFEIFSAEQILKDFELTYEELEAGIVDGEHDGGIDSAYVFVDDELVREDFEVADFKKPKEIEFHLVQSKSQNGFAEATINSIISTTKHLLSLDANYEDFEQYNAQVKEAFDRFRSVYRGLAAKFPELKIVFHYAAQKAGSEIHPNLDAKRNELIDQIRSMFEEASVEFNFLGAKELLAFARKQPNKTFELKVSKSLNGENGYVVLCRLEDYNSFLRDGGASVRTDLFESNVRDYQGSTEVNGEIAQSLAGDPTVDFWWLNNGVTLLGSRATLSGSIVTVENPQIVNGLQTSSQIAAHFDQNGVIADDRMLMVKIVTSEDEEITDKIIKATNSQNSVPPASLRATDKVQRDIEHALKSKGLFYDRRKNFYKNQGKSAAKIVSIPLLAQALMTLLRAEPDNARARPSSLIKKDEVYNSLFAETHPLDAYSTAALLTKKVETQLKKRTDLTSRDRNNLRFYVLYWSAGWAVKSVNLSAGKIAAIEMGKIVDQDVDDAIDSVLELFENAGGSDQVAKGAEFKITLNEELHKQIVDFFKAKKEAEALLTPAPSPEAP